MQQVTFEGDMSLAIGSELLKNAPVHLKRFLKLQLWWERYLPT